MDSPLAGVPNRYVAGASVDGSTITIVLNGFSRRFTEGPGNGLGHVFQSTDGGATWTNVDGAGASAFPDIPANAVAVLPDHSLVVGTDLGVVYRKAGTTEWKRLGGNFPVTTAIDIEIGPDGNVYAATHGRGIWRIPVPTS